MLAMCCGVISGDTAETRALTLMRDSMLSSRDGALAAAYSTFAMSCGVSGWSPCVQSRGQNGRAEALSQHTLGR